jgi:hypothetical protein
LTACGGPTSAYFGVTTKLSATANGKIDLTSYDPNFAYFTGAPFAVAGPRYIPRHSKGTAAIKLAATYDGGNWNVAGSYADGDVRFDFKGLALLGVLSGFGSNNSQPPTGLSGIKPNSVMPDLTRPMRSDGSPSNRITTIGGACIPVVTHYISTNERTPGTGYALFLVCDAPQAGASVADYTGEDYVKVFIPANGNAPGDKNPYGNYLSGGFMASDSATSVVASTGGSAPSATPTPLQPYPTPSTTNLTTVPTRPNNG